MLPRIVRRAAPRALRPGLRAVALYNVPPLLSPDLLFVLASMGHGDELVIADGNFPAASVGSNVVRADGHDATQVLDAVLELLPLDTFVAAPAAVMQQVEAPEEDAPVVDQFAELLALHAGYPVELERLERFEFYDRAAQAYAVVATGERRLYGNVILRKGVIPPEEEEGDNEEQIEA